MNIKPVPYPSDTLAKGWRFELDLEQVSQSDTWALASPEVRPWLLMLWATAWQQKPCGSMPADDMLIAARLGMPTKYLAKHKDVLLRGWWLAEDGRLYQDTIAERVQEMLAKRDADRKRKADYRARKDSASVPPVSHGTDKGSTRDSTGSDATRTSTSTTSSLRSEAGSASPQRGSRLPADWALPDEWATWARAERTDLDPLQTAQRFADYWHAQPGAKGRKADWLATWRNWVRNERAPAPHGMQKPQGRHAAAANTVFGAGRQPETIDA